MGKSQNSKRGTQGSKKKARGAAQSIKKRNAGKRAFKSDSENIEVSEPEKRPDCPQPNGRWKPKLSDLIQTWIAVVTTVGILVLVCELRELQKTTRATQAAVDEAVKQTDLIRDNASKELGAYLSVEPIHIAIENDEIKSIRYKVANSGSTPALNVTYANFLHYPTNIEAAQKWKWDMPHQKDFNRSFGFVPRHDSRASTETLQAPIKISGLDGGKRFYVVGRIYYKTVFAENCFVDFCMWWERSNFSPDGVSYCNQEDGPNEYKCAEAGDVPVEKRPFVFTSPTSGILAPVTGFRGFAPKP
ncbi:MAG: hypothetical protein VX871_09310 [Pseudomonadota bacterium]|nr:hypothetical protein [Pseudomonadota bacterium]